MKGKRLYALLANLNRSERRQLHHRCTKSSDQRYAVLKSLLDSKIENQEGFEKTLEGLNLYFQRFPDADKALRRFVDFACKEIENLFVNNFLEENEPERDFILANIFNLRSTQQLFEYYHEKAVESSKKSDNLWMLTEIIDHQIKWHTKGQMKEDMEILRLLLREKYEFNNLYYYRQLVQHYSTLSALWLDDSRNIDFFNGLLPDEEELKILIEKSPNAFISAQFALALARFSFRDIDKFKETLALAESIVKKLDKNDLQYDRSVRSLYYLKILAGIHYGADLKGLIGLSNEVVSINQKYQYRDSVSFFLNMFFLLLDGQFTAVKTKRKKFESFYFDESNSSYPEFLNALQFFIKNDYDKALALLNNLSYAPSDYVALWSKLMVLKIHCSLKNERLVKNLINRANKYLESQKGKYFTYNVSSDIIRYYKDFYSEKQPQRLAAYFIFFEKMLPE